MRARDDVLTNTGLSKKKRWIQKADSFFYSFFLLIMQRGKGLPMREDIKQDTWHTAFDGDAGDLSNLGQNHDPAERLQK